MKQAKKPTQTTVQCHKPIVDPLINVPGSKSITNRAFLIAAMAKGTSIIKDPLDSDDTKVMLSCLRKLGIDSTRLKNGDIAITGSGKFTPPTEPLFVGNAGTAARFLIAVAALVSGPITFDGDPYMRQRPMRAILDAIKGLGANHDSTSGKMPFVVTGHPNEHRFETNNGQRPEVFVDPSLSSQYVSALMMIAPMLPYGMIVRTETNAKMDAVGYLDITLDTMASFGVTPTKIAPGFWEFAPQAYQPTHYQVEPDYSGCTYFWAAKQLACPKLSIHASAPHQTTQPDAKSLGIMRKFPNMPAVIDGSQMQDSVPTLGVLAAFNHTPVRFIGIKNLRVKECDRIEAVAQGLNRLKPGLASIEGDDLIVHAHGPAIASTESTVIDSFDDHRIAMAFSLMALKMHKVSISNPCCVEKTFPNYWLEISKCGVNTSHL